MVFATLVMQDAPLVELLVLPEQTVRLVVHLSHYLMQPVIRVLETALIVMLPRQLYKPVEPVSQDSHY